MNLAKDRQTNSVSALPCICILAPLFAPHLGGIERYAQHLALKLSELGHPVIVVASNTEKVESREYIGNVKVYRLPVINVMGGRFPMPLLGPDFFRLISEIRGHNPDFYVINARFYLHSLLGVLLALVSRKPSLLIEHGTGHFIVGNRFLNQLGHLYEHAITATIKVFTSRFYGVSLACNEWLEHFGICASGVIYNSIDANFKVQAPKDLRKAYSLPTDAIVLTFAGRLIEEKGVRYLLEAFKRICTEDERSFLFIAGSGPLLDQLQAEWSTSKRVFLLGKIDYDEMMNLFSNTDITVVPSYFPEGLPTTILEAGLCGSAVITTPMGGSKEVVSNEIYGIMVAPQSVDDLYQAMSKLITDDAYRQRVAHNLHEKTLQSFDWGKAASTLSDILINWS